MSQIGKIGFLGGGKIARSMIRGFLAAGLTKSDSIIASIHPSDKISFDTLKKLKIETTIENDTVVQKSDIIFVSVKPEVVTKVLSEIKHKSDSKLFVSVAMGITLETLEANLSQNARVIRAMPNIAALVRSACSVYVRGIKATDEDASVTQKLLQSIGTCEEIPENYFDPVTALSGSGPAYIFVLMEALVDGAARVGLPRDLAYRLASQTVMGSGHMVRDSNEHPGQLKDNVASTAGSAAAGLKHLEEKGFRAAVSGAVEIATLKCRQISEY